MSKMKNKPVEEYLGSHKRYFEQGSVEGYQITMSYIRELVYGNGKEYSAYELMHKLENAMHDRTLDLTPIGESLGVKVGSKGCRVPLEVADNEVETKKMLYFGHWELTNHETGEVTESGDTSVYAVDNGDARTQIENIGEEEVGEIDHDIEFIQVWESIQ